MAAVRGGSRLGAQAERLAGRAETAGAESGARPMTAVALGYGAAGLATAGLALALGKNPLVCAGWLGARGTPSCLMSLGAGILLGALTVAVTRAVVQATGWARALHAALLPASRGGGDVALLAVAVAGATAEELLFRGLLVPLVGVVASSLLFGVLHQVRGRARWAWMAWATIMGLLFGTVFAMTGSLAGPLVAHAAINHWNLRFLRESDPEPRPRRLGGLLRR